ncbi:hypothetical protein BDL97_18G056300 [Sphagnum fallax]|nr:hypothetical protein BDL97_18G056300 [Sphagnum fallax]
MGYRMSKHASLYHFFPYFLLFGRHPIPPSSITIQINQVVDLDSSTTWAKVIAKRAILFRTDHSKNYTPCRLLNLDPTIITLIWIPPHDYPC